MKGVTIIIILSVVWSIISAIIEKKKAAAKKAASLSQHPSVPTMLKVDSLTVGPKTVDPVKIKIESLRRRKKPQQRVQVPKPSPPSKPASIKSLHVENCPLPPAVTQQRRSNAQARKLALMLHNKRNIRTAIVLSEILSKPVSQRI